MGIPYDGTARQLAARIPKALHQAVKLAAFADQVTVQDWVCDALEAHLRRVRVTDENQNAPHSP